MGFPGDSDGKASACNAGNAGSIPGLGRSSGEGNGNPLQYSCLENPMDRGAWKATVHGVHFQDKPFSITVIQVYAPVTDAEEAEVEQFYDDLKDLLELTPKKKKKKSFSS